MVVIVFKDRVATVSLRFVEERRNGWFQYRRRIPADVQHQFSGKRFFVLSLGRDSESLCRRVSETTTRLDREWARLRSTQRAGQARSLPSESAGRAAFAETQGPAVWRVREQPAQLHCLNMAEALKLYLLQHRKSDDQKFRADNARAVLMLTQKFGDRPIDLYTREHAEAFRDSIISGNSTGTARRYLNRIAAIFNKARKEKQLPFLNPFEGLGIPGEGKDERKRLPFTGGELALISAACRRLDDDIRHIVALQMDTGARAGEIVGLRVEDIVLDQDVAHVQIRPFGRVRTLKTPASERIVPLVGSALWAARSALKTRERAADGNPWLFPRYASDRTIKATHASNTLNKWLRSLPGVSNEKTTHCFRHAMRDRLRAAEVPSDIQDALGGWGTRSVGQQYGTGYPLALLQVAMLNLPLTTV